MTESQNLLSNDEDSSNNKTLCERFRGYFPVVVDIETGGFNSETDAMLEIAASVLDMNKEGDLYCKQTYTYYIKPFEGANIDKAALEFTGIDPYHPLRPAQDEKKALAELFKIIKEAQKESLCKRTILVGHNSAFDLSFLNAAIERNNLKKASPFHPFSSFDTATLAGLALGQTVLAKACYYANIEFDNNEAHTSTYDTIKTAELFCYIVNRWKALGGWPPEKLDKPSS